MPLLLYIFTSLRYRVLSGIGNDMAHHGRDEMTLMIVLAGCNTGHMRQHAHVLQYRENRESAQGVLCRHI